MVGYLIYPFNQKEWLSADRPAEVPSFFGSTGIHIQPQKDSPMVDICCVLAPLEELYALAPRVRLRGSTMLACLMVERMAASSRWLKVGEGESEGEEGSEKGK